MVATDGRRLACCPATVPPQSFVLPVAACHNCLRHRRYIDRFTGLIMIIPLNRPALRWVSKVVDPKEKVEIYEELRITNHEGVVFKEVDAPFSPGRPNSGGPYYRGILNGFCTEWH